MYKTDVFISAEEIKEIVGISKSKAYSLIQVNAQQRVHCILRGSAVAILFQNGRFPKSTAALFQLEYHRLSSVDLDRVVLCSSLHDRIGRYLIVEDHRFPVIRITL